MKLVDSKCIWLSEIFRHFGAALRGNIVLFRGILIVASSLGDNSPTDPTTIAKLKERECIVGKVKVSSSLDSKIRHFSAPSFLIAAVAHLGSIFRTAGKTVGKNLRRNSNRCSKEGCLWNSADVLPTTCTQSTTQWKLSATVSFRNPHYFPLMFRHLLARLVHSYLSLLALAKTARASHLLKPKVLASSVSFFIRSVSVSFVGFLSSTRFDHS